MYQCCPFLRLSNCIFELFWGCVIFVFNSNISIRNCMCAMNSYIYCCIRVCFVFKWCSKWDNVTFYTVKKRMQKRRKKISSYVRNLRVLLIPDPGGTSWSQRLLSTMSTFAYYKMLYNQKDQDTSFLKKKRLKTLLMVWSVWQKIKLPTDQNIQDIKIKL